MDDLFPIPQSSPDPLTAARAELRRAEQEVADSVNDPEWHATAKAYHALAVAAVQREEMKRLP